jgi:hypothetical protein
VITKINDGGPAFPCPDDYNQDGDPVYGPKNLHGMTLRDWFAGQALDGYLASWSDESDGNFFEPNHVAKSMYAFADAMLEAREVKP